MINTKIPVTAFMATSDLIAIGALKAINESAMSVPKYISVIKVQYYFIFQYQVDLAYPTAYFLSLMAFPTYATLRQDIVEKIQLFGLLNQKLILLMDHSKCKFGNQKIL